MSRVSTGIANEPQTLAERVVTLAATTTTITPELHAGKLTLVPFAASNVIINLPVATGTGDIYTFLSTVARTSGTIIINAHATALPSNVFVGSILVASGSNAAAGSLATAAYFSSTNDIITINFTTTGGPIGGDTLRIQDGAAAKWHVLSGMFIGNAGPATPFSG